MKFIDVTNENLKEAIEIQKSIFPLENGSEDLKMSVNGDLDFFNYLKYWIVKVEDENIGICGLYSYKEYPEDAWLGWFGILENERGKGYSIKILNYISELAKKMNYENLRLYTDEIDNATAVQVYKKFGMFEEKYMNEQDETFVVGQILIFSKNLNNNPVNLWEDKYLYLKEHTDRNN